MSNDLSPTEITRFRSKISRTDGCWTWTGPTNNNGYGRFNIYREGRRVRLLAHRLAYQLANGIDLDDSTVIRHDCDNPPCCNPAHLRAGTQSDNMQDAVTRSRINVDGLTNYRRERDQAARQRLATGEKRCARCKTVKPLNGFYRNKTEADGRGRWCKECMAERQRQYRREKREGGKSERDRRKIKRDRAAAAAKEVAA